MKMRMSGGKSKKRLRADDSSNSVPFPVTNSLNHQSASAYPLLFGQVYEGHWIDTAAELDTDQFVTGQPSTVKQFEKSTDTGAGHLAFPSSIGTVKQQRIVALSRADLCPVMGRPRVVTSRGNLREIYGFDTGPLDTYLYAEEALYLLETGKLEIFVDNVSMSVERARNIFLDCGTGQCQVSQVRTCTVNEYAVYKHLASLGFRLRRRPDAFPVTLAASSSTQNSRTFATRVLPRNENDEDEDMDIEMDHMDVELEPSNNGRGLKRKASFSQLSQASLSQMSQSTCGGELSQSQFFNSFSSTSQCPNYTVLEVESDASESDFEFEDESVEEQRFSSSIGVQIQEVDANTPCTPIEPMPSTSRAAYQRDSYGGIVELAESDSENDENAGDTIWKKLVPSRIVTLSYPSADLLPPNIPWKMGTFQCGSNKDYVDHLDCFVDSLSLQDSTYSVASTNAKRATSWKQWRILRKKEADSATQDSLLHSPTTHESQDVFSKLHLWSRSEEEDHRDSDTSNSCIPRINLCPFYLYGRRANKCHKNRLDRGDAKPMYTVAIVKSRDEMGTLRNNVPVWRDEKEVGVVIAIVSDGGAGSDIVFVTPDNRPLTSIFN